MEYILSRKVAKDVELLDEHIESLLDLLIYDGKVEKIMVLNVQRPTPEDKKRKRTLKGSAAAEVRASDPSEYNAPKRKQSKSAKAKPRKGVQSYKTVKKAKTSRKRPDSDSEKSTDAEFDSDEDVKTARNRAKGIATSQKRRKERKLINTADNSDTELNWRTRKRRRPTLRRTRRSMKPSTKPSTKPRP